MFRSSFNEKKVYHGQIHLDVYVKEPIDYVEQRLKRIRISLNIK